MPLCLKVEAGEVTDFDQCLCTMEFLDKMKPLQKILREKIPTTRRGIKTLCHSTCSSLMLVFDDKSLQFTLHCHQK